LPLPRLLRRGKAASAADDRLLAPHPGVWSVDGARAEFFHAFGDLSRQRALLVKLLALLGALEDEPLTVSELAYAIGRKLPATSQHLRVLRKLGLVIGERRRTTVYYRLASGPLGEQVRAVVTALEGAAPTTS